MNPNPMNFLMARYRSLVLIALIGAIPARGQEVKRYVSSKEGARLASEVPLRFAESRAAGPGAFQVDDTIEYQRMAGFGASFLEAGMLCLNSLPPPAQEEVLRRIFDPLEGAGFSAMKTPLAGTDFMSAGPWYTYDDTPGDIEMKHFSIQRDLGPNGLITYIKRARRYGQFALQAPMDYPPDWMLVDVEKNQDVNPKYYDALARYYLRYLQEYRKHGVKIDYLSLFNEPGVYTKIDYREIRELLKNHVAPLLAKSDLATKLQLSEAPTREDAARNYPVLLEDPEARRCVTTVPYHGYDLKHFDLIAKLHRRYPELPLWMTELCHAYEAGTPKTMKLPRYDFQDGDFWVQQMLSDLEAYSSTWIYWNLILDEKGGPWLVSPVHGNPDDNIQHPVVVINRQTKQVTYTGLYYYLAHFSKFVRPGAVRISTTGRQPGLRCIAFKNASGGLVAELVNSRDQAQPARLFWRGRALALTLPPVSITTCLWPEPPR